MSEDRRLGEYRRAEDKSQAEKIDKMYTILVGNGKMGLCAKVDVLWFVFIFVISGIGGTLGLFIWGMIQK